MFYCRKLSLANYLIKNGASIVEIKRNSKSGKYLCFVFVQNEILTKCLNDYKNGVETKTKNNVD